MSKTPLVVIIFLFLRVSTVFFNDSLVKSYFNLYLKLHCALQLYCESSLLCHARKSRFSVLEQSSASRKGTSRSLCSGASLGLAIYWLSIFLHLYRHCIHYNRWADAFFCQYYFSVVLQGSLQNFKLLKQLRIIDKALVYHFESFCLTFCF